MTTRAYSITLGSRFGNRAACTLTVEDIDGLWRITSFHDNKSGYKWIRAAIERAYTVGILSEEESDRWTYLMRQGTLDLAYTPSDRPQYQGIMASHVRAIITNDDGEIVRGTSSPVIGNFVSIVFEMGPRRNAMLRFFQSASIINRLRITSSERVPSLART